MKENSSTKKATEGKVSVLFNFQNNRKGELYTKFKSKEVLNYLCNFCFGSILMSTDRENKLFCTHYLISKMSKILSVASLKFNFKRPFSQFHQCMVGIFILMHNLHK
jgi:hypothetical protein